MSKLPQVAWYYQIMGETIGPVHAAMLRELAGNGVISLDTLVRRGANSDWVSASRVKGLFDQNGDKGAEFLEDVKHAPPPPPRPLRFLLSTGDIPFAYVPLDLVFAAGSSSEGVFQGVQPIYAYQIAAGLLKETAAQIGANAVLNIRFELRSAAGEGLIGAYQVFEVYSYGTAVRAADQSAWPRE